MEYAGDDYFVGVTPGGHAQVIDMNGERSAATSPFDLLYLAAGACTAADVVSILRKKRQKVTGYRVEVRGTRRAEHPRSVERMEVRHIVRGKGIAPDAVARAVELSTNKYCGVAATMRPTAEIVTSFEIIED